MPESLYKEFSPEQLRDLFSFLQNEPPRSKGPTMNKHARRFIRLVVLAMRGFSGGRQGRR